MPAELFIVNGPHAGARYPLVDEVLVGRAPASHIQLTEDEVGWRHCQVVKRGNRFAIHDLRTSAGTFVNGMRCAERWLEDRDQIGIGKTILMFRTESTREPAVQTEAKPVLMAACSLGFLFRTIATSGDAGRSALVKRQVLHVVSDLLPVERGALLVGSALSELREQLDTDVFEPLLSRLVSDGAGIDEQRRAAGVPLYTRGVLTGALMVQVTSAESERLALHLETLTAIATLASMAFEAAYEVETLKATKALLEQQLGTASGIIGNSPPIRRLLEMIEKVAQPDTRVLIIGESGTGKELIARALHDRSPRRENPFIAVNCAALSEHLFESELFGHEKGAFTGAISMKRGRFELAQGGTIFLDEVGELALPLQVKLLRVLQQREFERVGGTQVYKLDVRVVAATNRDLAMDVREGKFREDLYHRLNVVCIQSPPLRDRREDIPMLAHYFLERAALRCKRQVKTISPEAVELLVRYPWPGNVRELENAIERAVVLGETESILPEDLPEALLETSPDSANTRYHSSVGNAKREAILDAYVQGGGDYKAAAKILGLHPNYLLRLVRNMNLRDDINKRLE